ncbi:MAG: type II toxin-antitoxin system VapC family toxin [Nitrososphaeria archaeon]|nr:type II toxin-antitoxin system VapC family toxin [Nitrososphaeria archaeon]
MKVIDASSLAKFVNRERGWKTIEYYMVEGCITLDLAIKEVLNSLWKRYVKGEFNLELVQKIMLEFINNLPVKTIEQSIFLAEAIKISLKHKITIYDSLYLALAMKEGLELITSDEKQYKVALEENIRATII